jgi:hypothetical protein
MVDGLTLASFHTEMALRADAAGKTSGSLLLRLLFRKDHLHFPEVLDPFFRRLGGNDCSRTQVDFLVYDLVVDLLSRKLSDRQGNQLPRGEQVNLPDISIDGKRTPSAVGDGLNKDPGPSRRISSCEDARSTRSQSVWIHRKGSLRRDRKGVRFVEERDLRRLGHGGDQGIGRDDKLRP